MQATACCSSEAEGAAEAELTKSPLPWGIDEDQAEAA